VAIRPPRHAHRALLTSGALTLLTIAGHTAGRGALPDLLGLGIVAGLSYGLAHATSAVRTSPARLLAFLIAGQALLHVVLTVSSPHAHGVAAGGADPTAMALGHVVAAAIAAVVLTHADEVVERWLAFLSALLGSAWTPAGAVPAGPGGSAPTDPPRPRVIDTILRQAPRRGPPLLAQPQPA